ncbi:MAG: hypothetical protein MUO23_12165 [Anaerolineales bacterium]|nr:hypothetical protein [Anaerolineales bacterium]
MIELVRQLSETAGPSGREGAVLRRIEDHLLAAGVPVRSSPLSSLHVVDEAGGATRLLLVAAVDEPGLILSPPDSRGYSRAHRLGNLPAQAYAGRRIRTLTGASGLVVSVEAATSRRGRPPTILVDLGADATALEPAEGAFAVLDEAFAGEAEAWTGKALADRVGVAILLQMAAAGIGLSAGCSYAFLVQGQLGLRALNPTLRALAPSRLILIRGAREAEAVDASGSAIVRGKGPVLLVRHGPAVSDPRLTAIAEQAAGETGLPLQRAILLADPHVSRGGEAGLGRVPALLLAYPVGNAEGARQSVSPSDIEQLAPLLGTLANTVAASASLD